MCGSLQPEKMQFDRLVSTFKTSVSKFQDIQQVRKGCTAHNYFYPCGTIIVLVYNKTGAGDAEQSQINFDREGWCTEHKHDLFVIICGVWVYLYNIAIFGLSPRE